MDEAIGEISSRLEQELAGRGNRGRGDQGGAAEPGYRAICADGEPRGFFLCPAGYMRYPGE